MGGHPIIGERHEQGLEGLGSLLVRVEPPGKASRVEDDGHLVVNRLNDSVSLRGNQRARLNRLLALLPQLPETSESERTLILELEVVGPNPTLATPAAK